MRIAAKILVEGFLHSAARLEAELVDEHGWLHVPVDELVDDVQFFRCAVGSAPDGREHMLVDAPDARSRAIAQRVLSTRYPGSSLMFLRSQAEGRAAVDCAQSESLSFEAAAAVAVVMVVAAWDQSEMIVIEGGGARYELAVVVDDAGHWVQRVAT